MRRGLLLPGLCLVVASCILGTVLLWSQVLRGLDALSVAASDNHQWTLSQMEVEYVQLLNAVLLAGEAAAGRREAEDLDELRLRFDVFYSRVGILADGKLYQPIAEDPGVQLSLGRIRAFLADTAPLIDAGDDRLASQLEQIRASALAVRRDVRAITVAGVTHFAASAGDQRGKISGLVTQVAAVTVALVVALLGFAIVVMGMNRVAQGRARDLAIAGERLRTVIATALDAIIVADASGRVREYNPAAERIFGWRRDAAVGRLMTDLMIPEVRIDGQRAGTQAAAGGATFPGSGRVQMQARRSNGSLFLVEMSVARAPSPEGEMRIAFLRDISHRVADERALREARDRALEGERAKARFLAVMSHEMRTPLNGLLGSLELLEHGGLDAAQRRLLATLRSSGELLLHHVNDVLDISRLDAAGAHSFAREPVEPAALLAEIAEAQRAVAAEGGNAIELAFPPPSERPVLLGDPRRLRQALLNLLGNALKFTRNGRITLAFTTGAEDDDGLAIEFRISDTGIGIAAQDQSRIFEEFVTLDATYGRTAEGTGLGLAITRRLVMAMGGEIGVDSRPGEGSSFWFRLSLPVDRSRPASAPAAAAWPDVRTGPQRRVLMVEDNEVNRAILRAFLGKLGHAVDEAHDGDEGVRLAGMRRYDVIFMDISMPRISGIEATRLIRSGTGASRDAPIITVTAHALEAEIAAFRDAGIDAVLTKPIRLRDIAEAIEVHCTEATAHPGEAIASGARDGWARLGEMQPP